MHCLSLISFCWKCSFSLPLTPLTPPQGSFGSLCHGAGRAAARTAHTDTYANLFEELKAKGIECRCAAPDHLVEEVCTRPDFLTLPRIFFRCSLLVCVLTRLRVLTKTSNLSCNAVSRVGWLKRFSDSSQ